MNDANAIIFFFFNIYSYWYFYNNGKKLSQNGLDELYDQNKFKVNISVKRCEYKEIWMSHNDGSLVVKNRLQILLWINLAVNYD